MASEVLISASSPCEEHEWIATDYLTQLGDGVYDRICSKCKQVERVTPDPVEVVTFSDVFDAAYSKNAEAKAKVLDSRENDQGEDE